MKDENKKAGAFVNIDTEQQGPDVSTGAALEQAADSVKKSLREIMQPVLDALLNDDLQELLQDAETREKVLLPYIENVLIDPRNRKKYAGITAEQVLDNLDVLGRTVNPDDITAEIIKRAQQKKRADEARAKQRERLQKVKPGEKISYIPGATLKTTSTNLANEFFSFAPPITEIEGQLTLNTLYSDRSGQDIAVLSYFNFNEKELNANGITSRVFTDFDYFVAMVCNNLYLEGNKQVSLTKLWHEMGNPKSPNQKQLQELRKSLIKGMTTIINISNREVLEAWNIDTDSYTDIKSPVMPVILKTERSKANGNIMSETVGIYNISPFILVADPLNQITTWKKDILKLYHGSRTAKYWRVMRYLMQQIAWMRNDKKRQPVITFRHLFDAVGAKRTEDRNTALKLVDELLRDAFKPCKYISGYKIDHQKGRITLTCSNPGTLPEQSEKSENQK